MRKIKDYYFYKAKKEKYPARSVYKLQEIDKKYHIIKKGERVLDLGCSPGSWMKYCSNKVGEGGLVIGIDKEKPKVELLPNMRFYERDILTPKSHQPLEHTTLCTSSDNKKPTTQSNHEISGLKTDLDFERFDVVLSDLAPSTTGIKEVDQARSLELVKAAFCIAQKALKEKGHFVCKIFQGHGMSSMVDEMKKMFEWVKTTKPASVRKESFEIYIVGYGKKNIKLQTSNL